MSTVLEQAPDPGGPRPRRFVVACPACAEEDHWIVPDENHPSGMCMLCCDHRQVPRVTAERYVIRAKTPDT
jgi:hypothetical protein